MMVLETAMSTADAIAKWLHPLSRLLRREVEPAPYPRPWLVHATMATPPALPAGYEEYVAMNSTGVRSEGGVARLQRHDSCSSMQDLRLA